MRFAALLALMPLAACSAEREPAPASSPSATVAVPRTLVAADFDPATLGATVADMALTDPAAGKGLARVTAIVACPKAMTACDPAAAPKGTVFTYLLTVTPQAQTPPHHPAPELSPSGSETPVAPIEAPAELVRMTRPALGFNGAVGYSHAEAAAALGREDALTITLDQNQLIWRVTEGSGWAAGRPITLWWQSTLPPAKPAVSYRLEYAGKIADIRGPFPAADKPVERQKTR